MLHTITTLAIGMPGAPELIVIGVVALIIFGKRLPDVARSMGRSIVEFKKGLRDVKDDLGSAGKALPPGEDPPKS